MSQSLTQLCTEIRADLLTVPEVRTYQEVPDSVNEWPAIIILPQRGNHYLASHGREDESSPLAGVVDIQIEMHTPRARGLDEGFAFMTRMADTVPLRLYEGFKSDRFNGKMITGGNPQLSNNATPPIAWEIGPSEWDSTETLALVLIFQVTFEQEVL